MSVESWVVGLAFVTRVPCLSGVGDFVFFRTDISEDVGDGGPDNITSVDCKRARVDGSGELGLVLTGDTTKVPIVGRGESRSASSAAAASSNDSDGWSSAI